MVGVEQDARELWKSVLQAAAQALGSHKSALAAIGIANQRETTILWDSATGEPLAPAIVWQDRRTTPICRDLEEQGHAGYIRSTTGLVLDPYFSAVKVRWLLESEDRLANLAKSGRLKFGTVDSWLVWNLTGGESHVTDLSNASRTMLCDIERVAWSDELLSIFDIPRAVLPEIVPTSGRAAVTGDIDGIPAGVPIAGLAGDQHAALFGQACFEPGMLKVTYGTGCFLLANAGGELRRPKSSLLETVAWQIGSENGIRDRRQRFHRRGRCPMASRRPSDHRLVGRFGAPGLRGRRYRRSHVRTRVRRPWRALLEPAGAGANSRSHSQRDPGARRQSRVGVNRAPGHGRRRDDGAGNRPGG